MGGLGAAVGWAEVDGFSDAVSQQRDGLKACSEERRQLGQIAGLTRAVWARICSTEMGPRMQSTRGATICTRMGPPASASAFTGVLQSLPTAPVYTQAANMATAAGKRGTTACVTRLLCTAAARESAASRGAGAGCASASPATAAT
jgi:hypothetical protein